MELLPLILIPILFLFVTVMKPKLPAILQPAACAVCIAVASTWILLLVMYPFGQRVPMELIAILIGMSIVGVTYKLEGIYARRTIRNFWFVRLAIILGGLYTVFFAFEAKIPAALLTAVASFFAVVVATFFFQKETGDVSKRRHLDNCC